MRAAALALTALFSVACGSGTEVPKASGAPASPATVGTAGPSAAAASPSGRQLTVTASGFGVVPDASQPSGICCVAYGLTIRNESASEAVSAASLALSYQDASGATVATDTAGFTGWLGPGQQTGLAGSTRTTAVKAGMKLTARTSTFPQSWAPAHSFPSFAFSGVTFVPDPRFPKVTATIKSPFTTSYSGVFVYALGLDASGQIVGGGGQTVTVAAGATAAVTVGYQPGGSPPATVSLYAQPPTGQGRRRSDGSELPPEQ